MPVRHILVALLATGVLGLNFVAIKVGVAEMPPLLLTALRFLLVAIPAVFFIPRPNASLILVVSFGLMAGMVQFGLLFSAIALGMPAGLASLVIQMQVFFTITLAWVALRERVSPKQISGALLAALGIAALASRRDGTHEVLPLLLVLGAALAWAIANTLSKKAGRVDMLALVVWSSLASPIPLLVLSMALEDRSIAINALMHPTWASMGALLFLAYPTTLLAFTLWNRLLALYPAAAVAPFGLLIPVAGIGSTNLFLGEALSLLDLLACIPVFAGLALNVWGTRSPSPAATAPPR